MPKKTIRDHTTEIVDNEENNEDDSTSVEDLETQNDGDNASNESDEDTDVDEGHKSEESENDDTDGDSDEGHESEDEPDEGESDNSNADKWKKDARKWETRSKQNLKDLEEAKDKIQSLSDQLEQANTSLQSAEKKSILMEYGLAEDHADFVTGSVDEMNDKAKRLSDLAGAKMMGNRTQGTGGNTNSDPFKSYAESLGSI